MSIIDTIVSALRSLAGGGTEQSTAGSGSSGSQSEGQVSVEHEPDASTEAAVKGGDADAGGDAAAAGTDATASTGTLVDEDAGKEPAEAVADAGSGDVDESAEGSAGDADAVEGDESDADEGDADAAAESVETITGIGPAYGGRLSEFGIETVGELAAADAAEVAEGIDVSESRVSDWIERANDAS